MKILRKRLYDQLFFLYLFVLITCFTLRYKLIGEPSIRPLLWPGFLFLIVGMYSLIILFLGKYSKFLQTRFSINTSVIFLYTFLNLYILMAISNGTGIYTVRTALLGFILNISFYFLLVLFVLVKNITADELSTLLSTFFVYTAVIYSVIAILMYFNIVNFSIGSFKLATSPSFASRIHGHFGDPTSFGGMAGLGIVCAAYLLILEKKRRYFPMLLFLVISVLMSGSRNAIVSIFITMFLFLLLMYNCDQILKIILNIIGIVIVGGLFLYVLEPGTLEFLSVAFRLGVNIRLAIWKEALQVFREGSLVNMLFGHGYEYMSQHHGAAFNIILEFAVNYGLMFLFFFITLIIYIFALMIIILHKNPKNPAALFSIGMITYSLVFAMFIETILPKYFHIMNFAFICPLVVISRARLFPTNVQSKSIK